MDYKGAYYTLFIEITKAIELSEQQLELLKQAQLKTEEMYMSSNDPIIVVLKCDEDEIKP